MEIIITIIILFFLMYLIISKWDNLIVKNVKYERYVDKDRVFVGDTIKMTTEIINKKILPLPWISINTDVPKEFQFLNCKIANMYADGKVYRIVTSLLPYERLKRNDSFTCSKRGYYIGCNAKILFGDFFGLKEVEIIVNYPTRVIVYPRINPLEQLITPSNSPQGDVLVKRWIIPDPIEIIGVREYTCYDSFNTIDWKTTAKFGSLYVKKLDYTANPSVMIFLNIQTGSVQWRDINIEYIENGINIAAAIMEQCLKEKIPVGYTANAVFNGEKSDLFIEPKLSKNQCKIILEALAKTTYTKVGYIEKILAMKAKLLGKGSVIVVLTAYISNELRKEINWLAKIGYIIKVIIISDSKNVEGLDKNIEVLMSKDSKFLERIGA